jgi:lipopolysaccharide assembly outer membrane protein LptD (OstA)
MDRFYIQRKNVFDILTQLLVCLFVLALITCFPSKVYSEAFLSEDRVYYGADTYTVDYDKKIINAVGNAYFRKQTRRIDADRIIIHYAENKKIAYFYDNVVLVNKADDSILTGNYGEARFREEFYYLEGDTEYSDDKRTITAQKVEAQEGEGYTFFNDVHYSDNDYMITALLLTIEKVKATFKKNVHFQQIETKDSVYCDELTYFLEEGNVIFHDRVLYIEEEDKKSEDSLVIKSRIMRYFREYDMFLLLGDVFILNDIYTLRSSVVRYYKEDQILDATGDIVVFDGEKYIYCNKLEYHVNKKKVFFYNTVKGVFKQKARL